MIALSELKLSQISTALQCQYFLLLESLELLTA